MSIDCTLSGRFATIGCHVLSGIWWIVLRNILIEKFGIAGIGTVEKDLKVMDLTAATLCKDNNIKIQVFAIAEEGNVLKAVLGEDIGTIIE